MFSDAFSHEHQLLKCDPKHGVYLACALMVRGQVEISDIRRNIERFDDFIFILAFYLFYSSMKQYTTKGVEGLRE